MKYILNNVRGKRIELENKELCSECGRNLQNKPFKE